ncbi:MAG: aspartate 1-decarboxylase [Planctomycetaceae bacterium]|nr:aspartate 1-decarboxylase [Planctomycetaceae bacterium]
MLRTFMKGKIHRARVTQADLDYVGSIMIDADLMRAAGYLPYEKVEIYNITNGNRLATYVITGAAGSGVIGINGAAARLVGQGDLVIIASYVELEAHEIADHQVATVLVDDQNRLVRIIRDRVLPLESPLESTLEI